MKGLYIHIPFCVQKCKYCDFVSYPSRDDVFSQYVSELTKEMDKYRGADIDTVFIGGGTPTVLPPSELKRLLGTCFSNFNISSGCEFTVEANPGTLNEQKTEILLDGGVNRVSVGVQSFDDAELSAIGRIHDGKTAYNTICQLAKSGFSNINIDLMLSLPNQTQKSLARTLDISLSLPLTHISAYSLIIEEGTPIEKEYREGKILLPDEDADRDMYEYAVRRLDDAGFLQYEISNFAKDGFECKHNRKYWQCDEYIGIGVAAHSYLDGKRFFNTSDLNKYLSGRYHGEEALALSERDKISEFMIMGLRMNEGISESEFLKRFNRDIWSIYKKELERFIDGGFLEAQNGRIYFTDRGRNVSNSVLCEFV